MRRYGFLAFLFSLFVACTEKKVQVLVATDFAPGGITTLEIKLQLEKDPCTEELPDFWNGKCGPPHAPFVVDSGFFPAQFEISPEDKDTGHIQIYFTAYQGLTPVLTSTRTLTGLTRDPAQTAQVCLSQKCIPGQSSNTPSCNLETEACGLHGCEPIELSLVEEIDLQFLNDCSYLASQTSTASK